VLVEHCSEHLARLLEAQGSMLQILDAKAGFLVNGYITVSATVLVLEESTQLVRESDSAAAGEESLRHAPSMPHGLS
jgi:hypothetical protein